ncbi:MAG: LPS export ABC transporter permease LptF [Alphaproteobacteria bacterium]
MQSITRYITKQILGVTIFVTIALCFAIWLTQSLRLIDMILNRGLPITTFLELAMLLMPSFLVIVVPIAAFCATLFTYNKLITDSELIVMRSAGLSSFSLAKPGIIVGVAVMAFTYLLTLYLLPLSFRHFKDLEFRIRNDFSTVLLQEGIFNTLANGITVYVRERGAKGELQGILLHDNRDREHPVTMMAERGALVPTPEGPRVVLVKGNRQQVSRDGSKMSLLYFDRYTVDVQKATGTTEDRWREPPERFLHELFHPDGTIANEVYRNQLIAEGHARLITPVLPLTYCVIAMAFLLSGTFNRRGHLRLVVGAIAALTAILCLSLAFQSAAARYPITIVGMYLNAFLPLFGGLYFIFFPPRTRIPPAPLDAVPAVG